ncbi:hypothetical protein [Oceanobacillus damuensis]|uniref:hypothetical protein n=1 Tax=Oceanobacillus damuensis TaxID=937928 RepID=UPI0012EDCA97|nr:hypothetical protein [Oceanobacillus damuensis]
MLQYHSIESIENMEDTEHRNYIEELFVRCAKIKDNQPFMFENYQSLLPLQLTVNYFELGYRQFKEQTVYSLAIQKFTKR